MPSPIGNVEEIQRLIAKALTERGRLDQTIHWLQQQLREVQQGQVLQQASVSIAAAANQVRIELTTVAQTLSIRQKCEVILAGQPQGLTLPALYAELRKSGYQSTSEGAPTNIINTILNRQGKPFVRIGEKWFHEAHAVKPTAATPAETKESATESTEPPKEKEAAAS